MRGFFSLLKLGLVGGGLMIGALACGHMESHKSDAKPTVSAEAPMTPIERGRYIVLNSSSCVSCHKITLPASEPAPVRRGNRNPDLARLTEEEMLETLKMLETGERTPRTMPVFRLSPDDLAAVAAYFRMLNAAAPAAGTNP